MKQYILGLDIGTTSVKAVLFIFTGTVIGEAEEMISTSYPNTSWVEQNPDEIEQCAIKAIRTVIKSANINREEIVGVGISCAMHSLICVDEKHNALSNALIWSDSRSSKQVEDLKATNLYLRTGTPYHPMTPLTKLMWMSETNFKPYQEASYFMSIKEYILLKWFNRRVIDYSMAAATGLFNIYTFTWDEEALEIAGISLSQLSEIVPPTEILNEMNKDIANQMSLSTNTSWVIGAADGQLANLGSGAMSPGEVAVTVGTSGAIRKMIRGTQVSDDGQTFCYPFTNKLSIVGGPTNNGGIVLDWVKNMFEYDGSFEGLIDEAKKVEIGAEGLIFHPYINGERAPLWDSAAKGNLFGLRVTHRRKHIVRAVLEGITYNLYDISHMLEFKASQLKRIYANGGLVRSDLFVHILADVFGVEVHISESHHNAAWGAAWTALVALNYVNSFEGIKNNIPIKSVIQPNEKNHQYYQEIFEKYRDLGKSFKFNL